MNLSQFAHCNFVKQPTPIESMNDLAKKLGTKANLWIKRDDLLPGAEGGNKTRKLDFALADAQNEGANAIVTCGAIQSNHCRLTLYWAIKLGMQCHLILEERVPNTYKENASGNNFLYKLLGANSIQVVKGGSDVSGKMQEVADELAKQGLKPYIIPGGASYEVGALGYVNCAQEIAMQSLSMGIHFDHIVVPSGSSGTHAGMVTGIEGISSDSQIHGINVSRPKDTQEDLVFKLVQALNKKLNIKHEISKDKVICYGDYVGPGYSLPTEEMVQAIKTFAKTEGLLLDPVYTGKLGAGYIDLIKKGLFKDGNNVLLLHTGGSPVLYAYTDLFD